MKDKFILCASAVLAVLGALAYETAAEADQAARDLLKKRDYLAASKAFGAVMKAGFRAGAFRHIFQWSAPVIGAPGLEFVCAARVNACDPTVAADLTKGLFETRRQVRALVDLVNRDYPMPAGERLSLVTLGSDLGVRERTAR